METQEIFTLDSFKDISLLSLGKPNPLPGGGSYYSKLLYNNKPIDIQAHACLTKQGIVNTGTKTYCDLMYDNKELLEPSLIQILEQIEERCIELIFEKRNTWFSTPLEISDIESAFTSCMRLYKSGKYTLLRTNIPQSKKTIKTNHQNICEVYNQKGETLSLDSITSEVKVIPLIRIDELRFTSKSFHININLNQCLVLDKVDESVKKGCRIKLDNTFSNINSENNFSLKEKELSNEQIFIKENNNNKDNEIKKESKISTKSKINEDIQKKQPENKDNFELQEVNIVAESYEEEESDNESIKEIDLGLGELQEQKIIVDEDSEEDQDEDEEEFDGMKVIKDLKVDMEATSLKLKKPDEVYYDLYKQAKEKAKQARKEAISLFLEAKSIKAKYMLNEIDESDDDEEFYSDI